MRFFKSLMLMALLGSLSLWAVQAHADAISGLFDTGVVYNNTTMVDQNYTLVSAPAGYGYTTSAYVLSSGWPLPSSGPWVGNSTASQWIVPSLTSFNDGLLTHAVGPYTYETTFNLTGYNPATASITGQWSSDNEGLSITINGHLVPGTTNVGWYTGWTAFSIPSGSGFFLAGLNTLEFTVNNDYNNPSNYGNPTGLNVQMTGTVSPVPVPPSALLLAPGLLGLVGMRKRFKM